MKFTFLFLWFFWIGFSLLLVCFKGPLSELFPFFLPEFIGATTPPFQPPSLNHLWGTDELGRDVLVRLLFGTGYSLLFGFIVAFLTTLLGFCFGIALSLSPRNIRGFLTLGVDTLSSLPFLPLALIALSFYPSQLIVLGLLKTALSWGTLAQTVRMESEIVLEGSMIEAARSQGLTRVRIAYKYLVPSLIPTALGFFPLLVFSTILSLATLDYFGLAFPIPMPNLAEMFRQFQENQEAWWLFLFPFLVTTGLLWGLQTIDHRLPNRYPFGHGASC